MMFLKRIPRLVRWILSVLLSFVVVMTIFRFLFYFRYNPFGKPFSGSAFFMGLRFDIKFLCILGVSMLLLCSLPFFNPLRNKTAQKIWMVLLPLVFMLMVFFYSVDYFYYDYLQQRLNASVLNYFNDAGISFNMAMESYPVFKVLLGLVIISIIAGYVFNKILVKYQQNETLPKRKFSVWYIIIFLLFGMGVFGKIGQFNL